jgi:hypothetical protein
MCPLRASIRVRSPVRGATSSVSPRALSEPLSPPHDDRQPAHARDAAEGRIDPLQRQVGVGRSGAQCPHRRAADLWLRRDGSLEIGDQLVVASERQRHLDPLGPDGAALVVEPRRCRTRIPFHREIAEHITPPEGERLVEAPERLGVPSRLARRPRGGNKRGEPRHVQLTRVALDDVAGCARRDQRGAVQPRAEPGNVLVHQVTRAARRSLTPQTVDQSIDRHDLSGVEKQDAEERPFTLTRELDPPTVDGRFEPPENPANHVRHGTHEDRTGAEGFKRLARNAGRARGWSVDRASMERGRPRLGVVCS